MLASYAIIIGGIVRSLGIMLEFKSTLMTNDRTIYELVEANEKEIYVYSYKQTVSLDKAIKKHEDKVRATRNLAVMSKQEQKVDPVEQEITSQVESDLREYIQGRLDKSTSIRKRIEESGIDFEEGVGATSQIAIVDMWEKIPENIRERFKADGWKVLVTKNDLSEYDAEAAGSVGCTVMKEKLIYIYGGGAAYAQYSVIHEMGHFVDITSGLTSRTDIFREIFEEEKKYTSAIGSDSYAQSNEAEFYAEVFKSIILDPETTKACMPYATEIIEWNISEM